MASLFWPRAYFLVCVSCALFLVASTAWAVDIEDVQAASLSNLGGPPVLVNVWLQRPSGGAPLPDAYFQASFDTGTSGALLSKETADALGVIKARMPDVPTGELVVFEDVGVGGDAAFHVSEPLYVNLAPYHPDVNPENPEAFSQTFGPMRVQINPNEADWVIGPLDVFGMPTMHGKVVVMDARPVDNWLTMDVTDPNATLDLNVHTFIYDPETPFNSGNDSDPGIPPTNHCVSLRYGDFSRFTRVTPTGAEGPLLQDNPFIGPNPVAELDPDPPPDDTPGITVALGGLAATGSFLFDTGAAASIVSSDLAADLNVRYEPGTEGSENPVLEVFNPSTSTYETLARQFQAEVGGIGGRILIAGFYLDSLLLPTMEADNPLDSNDPDNIRFLNAPVLVFDINVRDPITLQELTLDGVFGMNYLTASVATDLEMAQFGAFNWLVFDEPAGILRLDLKSEFVPEPGTFVLLAAGVVAILCWRRLKRIGRAR